MERASQLTNQDGAAAGGDPRSLEIDLQRSGKRELKGLILFLTPCYEHRCVHVGPRRSKPGVPSDPAGEGPAGGIETTVFREAA